MHKVKTDLIYKKLHKSLPYFIFLIIIIVIFWGQNNSVGFESGHHGWVSAHVLAIISRANLNNNFLGYTLQFVDSSGQISYDYFDRGPIFFGASMNFFLSFFDDNLPEKVYIARQLMNAVFIITMITAFILMKKLINHNTYLALSVVLVSFASYPLLFYKDMVQLFDQPALLGSLFLILAITLYKNNKNKRWLLYLAVLISIGLGIGYASVVLLGIWFGLETIWLIKSSFSQKKDVIKKILTHDSLIALVVGIVWASSLLAYNIYNEAKIRNTSLQTVGIIDSAARRLGLNKDFNQIFSDDLNWLNFTTGQIERIADRAIPIGHRQLSSLKYLIIIPMIIIIPWFIRCNTYPRQMLFLLMSLFGIVWLFLMKNFAAFHSYTAMYYIGLILTFYAGLFSISFVKKYTTPLLIGCAILFFTSHYVAQRNHSYQAESVNDYTYDFDQIARIVPPKAKIFYPEGYSNLVPGVPYAVGFYLTQTYISPRETADYIISTDRNYQGPTLTSHNKKIFVFENQSE